MRKKLRVVNNQHHNAILTPRKMTLNQSGPVKPETPIAEHIKLQVMKKDNIKDNTAPIASTVVHHNYNHTLNDSMPMGNQN